ncbi:MAG: DcrB-related protein [Pyrinomonadaceae bacterium]
MQISHNEFTTTIPDDWQDRTMLTLVAPFAPGQFATNVVVTRHEVAASDSIESFAKLQLEMMQNSLPAFELLDSRATTINGRPAIQQLHRFRSEQGEFVQQVQTFVLGNLEIYAMTGTARISEFNQHIDAFRQIMDDVHLLNSQENNI